MLKVTFSVALAIALAVCGRALAQSAPGEAAAMVPTSPSPIAANPSATASDTAANGSATTFMRSDAAPAIQKGSSSQFGVVKVDGSTITASSGVISAASTGPSGYIVGNWTLTKGMATTAAGTNPGIGSIRCYTGFFNRTITSSNFAVRIGTTATGNVQAAIYATSAAGRPTGNALVATGSMSTATAAPTAAAVFQFQADVIYWFCTNMDNTGAIAVSVGSTGISMGSLIGDATLTSLLSTGGGNETGVSFPQAFGTWPDLTLAVSTALQGTSVPIVPIQIGSVP